MIKFRSKKQWLTQTAPVNSQYNLLLLDQLCETVIFSMLCNLFDKLQQHGQGQKPVKKERTGILHDFFKWSFCLANEGEVSGSSSKLALKTHAFTDRMRIEMKEHNVAVPR